MTFEIIIPHLGATGGDVQLIEWLVREGDYVRAGTPLFTIETDKATDEVQAFRDGYVRQFLAPPGAELEPGAVVALLTDTANEPVVYAKPTTSMAASTLATDHPATVDDKPQETTKSSHEATTATARARRLAEKHGIDLNGIASSSSDGIIQARDVTAAVASRAAGADLHRLTSDCHEPLALSFLLDAFRRMALIRHYEEHLYHLFLQGQVPGTLHQCQGQEAVAVGVCFALRTDDLIFSTHRPVGHMIAKGASLNAITAEIWGKATGCVGGKGGQMHLADLSVGAMVSNAIVGANIPIATGAAMAFRLQGIDRVAVSFFGDGASNIGAFHEGINLAAVQNAPVVFVCENNLYAASTHVSEAMRIRDIADRAKGYGIPGYVVDGMDFPAVYASASDAVRRARAGAGPTLLEYKTYRYRGHSRGDPCGYRNEEEYQQWSKRDPVELCRHRLTREYGVDVKLLVDVERECQDEVEAAVAFAVASPDPPASACAQHVFAD